MKKIRQWFNDRRDRKLRERLVQKDISDKAGLRMTLTAVDRALHYINTGSVEPNLDEIVRILQTQFNIQPRDYYENLCRKVLALLYEETAAKIVSGESKSQNACENHPRK